METGVPWGAGVAKSQKSKCMGGSWWQREVEASYAGEKRWEETACIGRCGGRSMRPVQEWGRLEKRLGGPVLRTEGLSDTGR